MPALQIRDLPDELYEGLRARAAAEHRSLAQQATVAIEQHLGVGRLTLLEGGERLEPRFQSEEELRQMRIAKRKAIFDEIHRMPRFEPPEGFPDVVELIHQGREELDDRFGC